jgi:hypothetical protein
MDDSYQELEDELKALRPRRPSARLHARLARDLEASPARGPRYATATNLRSWKWLGWPALGAVVALVLAAGVAGWLERSVPDRAAAPAHASSPPATGPQTAAGDSRYRPVSASSVLYDLRDEGMVTLENDQPARQARFRYVDTYTWRNPATDASLRLSVPRDEVRVLPANYH